MNMNMNTSLSRDAYLDSLLASAADDEVVVAIEACAQHRNNVAQLEATLAQVVAVGVEIPDDPPWTPVSIEAAAAVALDDAALSELNGLASKLRDRVENLEEILMATAQVTNEI